MKKLRKALGMTGAVLAGSVAHYQYQQYSRKKLHVDVMPPTLYLGNVNILPGLKTCFGMLPESIRHSLLLAAAAPGPGSVPRDRYDILGENPYTVTEVRSGVWQVGYDRENHFMTKPAVKEQMKLVGLDFQKEETAARIMQGAEGYGRECSAVAHRDIALVRSWDKKDKIEDEEIMKIARWRENMMVVKLNNGSVMLYAPVKIHDETEFGNFLKELGKVEWIVAPSSEHTLQLPGIIKQFPEAKIIGATNAEKKLNHVNALPNRKFDFDYTSDKDLEEVNKILNKEGVELFYIKGDVTTHSLFSIAHNVALECDLLYTHHDGEGFLMMDKEEFRKFVETDAYGRCFKFKLLSKPNSPNGFLPPYRFNAMDASLMWPFMFTPPKPDGSSCKEMAQSLRFVLNKDFDKAVGVHFNIMDAKDFKKGINSNWNWLDGNSLLEET